MHAIQAEILLRSSLQEEGNVVGTVKYSLMLGYRLHSTPAPFIIKKGKQTIYSTYVLLLQRNTASSPDTSTSIVQNTV